MAARYESHAMLRCCWCLVRTANMRELSTAAMQKGFSVAREQLGTLYVGCHDSWL